MFITPAYRILALLPLLAVGSPVRNGYSQLSSTEQPFTPAAAASTGNGGMPEIARGSVTLPYTELRALWLAAQPRPTPAPEKPPEPPVPYTLQSARYDVAFTADDPREGTVEAAFEALTFGDGWTAVPLLGVAGARLTSIEPAGTLVTVRDGAYTLLSSKPGPHPVKLRFSTLLSPHGDANGKRRLDLRLETIPAVINELALSKLPPGWLAEVAGGATGPASLAAPADGTPLRFNLTPESVLALTLSRVEDQLPAQPPAPPAPSVWQGEAQSLVRYDEGRLAYKTHLRIATDAGAGLTATLTLPASTNVLSVSGDDLDHWRVARTEEPGGGGARRLEITWKTAEVPRRELTLAYDRPQLLPGGDWRLASPGFAVGQGRLEAALYALPAVDGLEFTADEGTVLSTGNTRQLPHWLTTEIGGKSFVLLSETNAAPAGNESGVVHARQLPLVQTAQATVEESSFETRLVADGALLSKGTLLVRHDGTLTLALALPPRAQLLSCQADGHDTAPIDRGGGRIEIPLPAGPVEKPTQVKISYTDKQPALAPVAGQLTLTLPQTPLFVQSLRWELQIPDAYELMGIEGNVSQVFQSTGHAGENPLGIHLSKDLLNGEQPTVELFYQKRAVAP